VSTQKPVLHHPDVHAIDCFAYAALALLMSLYSIFIADFAEMHWKLPFTRGLPLFPGEAVLFLLILLAIFKAYLLKLKPSLKHLWIFVLTSFILIKAFAGYQSWGALAFRNAALFYYFVYALLAFFFYSPKLVHNKKVQRVALSVLLIISFFKLNGEYYTFTYLMLICYLLMQMKEERIVIIVMVLVIVLFPFSRLIETSRSAQLGSVVAIFFMGFGLAVSYMRESPRKAFIFIIASLALIALGYLRMSETTKSRLRATININNWIQLFRHDLQFANRKLINYSPKKFRLRLYEMNKANKIKDMDERQEYILENEYNLDFEGVDEIDGHRSRIKHNTNKDIHKVFKDFTPDMVTGVSIKEAGTHSMGTLVWRLMLWTDLFDSYQYMFIKPHLLLFGYHFGKPIRSRRLEAAGQAFAIITGWFSPHNFALHVVYRAGMFGMCVLIFSFYKFLRMIVSIIRYQYFTVLILMAIAVFWTAFSLTLVVLELPHYAIVFWSVLGFSIAEYRYVRSSQYQKYYIEKPHISVSQAE